MTNFFMGPFDFDGDGILDPAEIATEYMIFDECMNDDDSGDGWSDDSVDSWDDGGGDDWGSDSEWG